jgi:hypothetical protein
MSNLNQAGQAHALARQPIAVRQHLRRLTSGVDVTLVRSSDPEQSEETSVTTETLVAEALIDAIEPLRRQILRATLGARLALLLVERAWVESFDVKVSFDWELGDEGQIYETAELSIANVVSNGSPCDDHHAVDDHFDADVAAEEMAQALESWESDLGTALRWREAQLDDDGTAVVAASLERRTCAGLLDRARISGLAVWDALFGTSVVAAGAGEIRTQPETPGAALQALPADTAEFAASVVEQLMSDGYEVHAGGSDHGEDLVGRWWFSWCVDGMAEPEVGPTCESEEGAWATALAHRLSNSAIHVDRV